MPVALTSGTRLGHYEIIAAIGAGGMCAVYRARDPRLDREVAIKVLSADVALDAAAPGRAMELRRDAGQRWIFQRNDDFSPSLGGPANLERIVVSIVDEPTTKFAKIEAKY